jgi:hypothetical protein
MASSALDWLEKNGCDGEVTAQNHKDRSPRRRDGADAAGGL